MNKKALILVCVLLVCLTALTLVACGGQYEMNGFVVDFGKLQSSYQVGDSVDLSVIKVTATFTDDTTEVIPLDRVTIKLDGTEITVDEALTKITEKVGEHILKIEYSDQSKSFTITVTEKHVSVLTGLKLQAADTFKATYNYGETVDLAGLKVIAVYDRTDEVEVALADVELFIGQERVAADLSTITDSVGARSLTAKYQAMTSENTVTITVNDVYSGVTITAPTDIKRSYKVGEEVVLRGFTAKANYASGVKVDVPAENIKIYNGAEIANLATLTATKGDKRLRVEATYEGKTGVIDFPITVENYVTAIAVDVTDVPHLNFVVDDVISVATFAAAKVTVTYADPADNTVLSLTSNGVTMTDVSKMTNTAGNKVVTVTYGGKSDVFNFTVAEGETAIDTLTVESTPYKSTTLTAGDTGISFSDLTIKAVYKDEFDKDDAVIAFADFATKGVTLYLGEEELTDLDDVTKVTEEGENDVVVKVKYEGKFAQFTIKVNNGVTALRAVATKTQYKLDEVPTFEDVVVTATLNYGEKVIAIKDVEFYNGDDKVADLAVFTSAVANSKEVRVKYKAFAAFTISVVDYKVGIYTKQATFTTDVDVTENARYDFLGKVFWVYHGAGNTDEAVSASDLMVPAASSITVPTEGKQVTISANEFDTTVTLVVKEVLESIVVSNIPTLNYGAAVNFTNLVVTGHYTYKGDEAVRITQEDGESYLYGVVKFAWKASAEGEYAEIAQTNLDTIATSSGTHYVKLTYTFNDKDVSDEFAVTVEEPLPNITGFEKPTALTSNTATRTNTYNNRNLTDGDAGYEGSFIYDENENDVYYVGDDNAYKFLPKLTQVNIETEESTTLKTFKSDSKVYYGEELLTAEDNKATGTKSYKKDETVYVVENYNTNEFDFTDAAIGKTFTLSVLPDVNSFPNAGSFSRVEQTVMVVDGYNVTDPRQLCLLEQTTTRHYWDAIKAELGLTGLKPATIILHDNMQVTKDSIPETFYYTLPDTFNLFYTYEDGEGEHTVKPEDVPAEFGGPCDRTFLYEGEYGLFRYDMGLGDSFKIYGNYFDIDLTRMPRVAAFEPNLSIAVPAGFSGTYYGQYQSKISFLVVYGVKDSSAESFEFKDFAVKGNTHMQLLTVSGTSDIKQGTGDLVYAGGLIFVKVWYSEADITNINAHDCFIPYFSYGGTEINYTNCKAYDSFQCALFVNKNSVNHLNNCHWKRANGPLMLLCQDWDSDGSTITARYVPEIYADSDCVLESIVDSQSVWFTQNGVTAQVNQLASLDGLFNGYFHKTLFQAGKFNVIAVSIAESGNQDPATQSFIQYGNCFVDRKPGQATTPFNHPEYGTVPADLFDIEVGFMSAGAATFTVGNNFCAVGIDTENPAYAESYGYYLQDANQINVMGNSDVMTAFRGNTYQYIAINVGPMGILAEFYPLG